MASVLLEELEWRFRNGGRRGGEDRLAAVPLQNCQRILASLHWYHSSSTMRQCPVAIIGINKRYMGRNGKSKIGEEKMDFGSRVLAEGLRLSWTWRFLAWALLGVTP